MTSQEKIATILSDKKVLKLHKLGKCIMEKKWYKSRTLWAGVFQIIAGISIAIEGQISAGTAITFFGMMMLVLRIITKNAIIK